MALEQRSTFGNEGAPSRSTSQSVARALTVLDVLGQSSDELGVRELARRMSLPPSIVQRLVNTLGAFGYIEQSRAGKYRVGLRAFQIGRNYLAQNDLHTVAMPELRALAERDHVNAFLGVLKERSIVYLATVQSRGPISITASPGARTALHSTALGKCLLSELSDDEIAGQLGPGPLEKLTPKTKTSVAAVLKDLRETRKRGYAICDEENLPNVYAIGAVLRDASGRAVAAISGALPRHPMRREDMDRLRESVTQAAARISQRLGAPMCAKPGISISTR